MALTVPAKANVESNGTIWFALKDPEGNPIEFVQERPELAAAAPRPVSKVMIHAGFVVHDRAAEDKFYKDLLGFHVYWHGGMKDDGTDWIDMQVPDGTQWLEYMMVREGQQLSPRTLGVLNHIAFGSSICERCCATFALTRLETWRERERADWERRQVAIESVRPGRHARRLDGVHASADALLFVVHRHASTLNRENH